MSNHRKYWARAGTKIIECLQNMPIKLLLFPEYPNQYLTFSLSAVDELVAISLNGPSLNTTEVCFPFSKSNTKTISSYKECERIPLSRKSLFSLLNLVLTRLTFMHKAAPGKMKCVKIRTKKESTPAVNTKRWDNQNLIPNYFMQNISWSNFSKSPQISMHFILTVRVKLRGFGKVTSICFYSLAHRMLTNRRGQFFGNVSSQLINFSFWKKNIFLLFCPHLPKQLLYLEIHWSQIHWSSGILRLLNRGRLWQPVLIEAV